jgi:glycosyltransferase involved in cell wall biosynthesis
MSKRERAVLLVDTDGLNPYGRCLALALSDAGERLDFHRRRAPQISGYGRPFGPTRSGRGSRWLRAVLLGASLVRVSLRVPKSHLVHTLWETRADLLLASFAKLVCRRPLVVTIHDAARPGKRAERTLMWLARLADRLIVHSERIKSDLVARVPSAREKIEVVPLLNYTSQVCDGDREGARLRLGLSHDAPLVLFFGQLRAGKGLETLFRATDEILTAAQGAHLVIAGSDPASDWADKLAALKARYPEQVVLFVQQRPLPDQTLSDLVLAADVVALPFTRASQSSSAIFALSHRRPVVTTAVGAVEELGLAGAVALVSPGDAKQLADACIRLLAAPQERDDLANNGFVYASTELSPNRIAEKTRTLYGLAVAVPAT